MILLRDKTNVDNPSGAWPYGDLRNNPGDNSGTPVDKVLVSDVMQTMEQIFAQSGLTANGLLDNASDGFQLFQAMQTVFGVNNSKPWVVLPGGEHQIPSPEGVPMIMVDQSGFVHFKGVWSDASPDYNNPIFTIPVGYRPQTDLSFSYTKCDAPIAAATAYHVEIRITASTGEARVRFTGATLNQIYMVEFPSYQI